MASEALVLTRASTLDPPHILGRRTATPGRARVNFGGVLVDQVDFAMAVARLRGFLASGAAHQVVTVNLDFVSIAQHNRAFHDTLNQADLAVADGMPLVWLSRLQGQPLVERLPGVELVDAACQLAVEMDQGVFLLGAAPGVADQAGQTLQDRFPGLHVVGTYSPPHGPLSAAEDDRIVRMIREAAPGFLFVALGAPRQDLWIREHLHRLEVPVAMGVGCVFDLLAGEVRRAPGWMRRTGLEWAFRLGQEPGRLWRRYLVQDLPMMARLFLNIGLEGETSLASAALGSFGRPLV